VLFEPCTIPKRIVRLPQAIRKVVVLSQPGVTEFGLKSQRFARLWRCILSRQLCEPLTWQRNSSEPFKNLVSLEKEEAIKMDVPAKRFCTLFVVRYLLFAIRETVCLANREQRNANDEQPRAELHPPVASWGVLGSATGGCFSPYSPCRFQERNSANPVFPGKFRRFSNFYVSSNSFPASKLSAS